MKILNLVLKAKWYDLIESGVKLEEYREIKEYWLRRFCWHRHLFAECIPSETICPGTDCSCEECFRDSRCVNGDFKFYPYTHVRFSYGYTSRTMTFEIKDIRIGIGNPEWGAPDKEVFIIELGNRTE